MLGQVGLLGRGGDRRLGRGDICTQREMRPRADANLDLAADEDLGLGQGAAQTLIDQPGIGFRELAEGGILGDGQGDASDAGLVEQGGVGTAAGGQEPLHGGTQRFGHRVGRIGGHHEAGRGKKYKDGGVAGCTLQGPLRE